MLNVIPDIHADPQRLKRSLKLVGDDAPIAFLGDLIDAGSSVRAPDDKAVLDLVKGLVERGDASCIMGNHELNAILYHRFDKRGRPLRSHLANNTKQHQSFIGQFGTASKQALAWTDWFLCNLPLWRELDGVRLVHACWSESAIQTIKERRHDGYLHSDDLEEIAAEATPFGRAVNLLVSGIEARLPEPFLFTDFSGHKRSEVRLAWWRSTAQTWRETALSVPNIDELPEGLLPQDIRSEIYPSDAKPVFVGHYKMSGNPVIEAPNALCLDYPNMECGYRWNGEAMLTPDNIRMNMQKD